MINDDLFKLPGSDTKKCVKCGSNAEENTHFYDNGFDCPCGKWVCPNCADMLLNCGKCY